MEDKIVDSMILLPALGFPAIARLEDEENNKKYKVFVSILIIYMKGEKQWNRKGDLYQRRLISKEIGLTEKMPPENIIKFTESDIDIHKPFDIKNSVYWRSSPDFIEKAKKVFFQAYQKRTGQNTSFKKSDYNKYVIHIEFDIKIDLNKVENKLFYLFSNGENNLNKIHTLLRTTPDNEKDVNSYTSYPLYSNIPIIKSNTSNIPIINIFKRHFTKGWRLSRKNKSFSGEKLTRYHPVYFSSKERLNIAHLSDTHISCRWDAMHYWSRVRSFEQKNKYGYQIGHNKNKINYMDNYIYHWEFNNPNDRFEDALKEINKNNDIDIIIITGDLIDYNRGYSGEYKDMKYLKDKGLHNYSHDRNWYRFREILVNNYKKPIFTILGNHDYRVEPFGPLSSKYGSVNYAYELGLGVPRYKKSEKTAPIAESRAFDLIYPNASHASMYTLYTNSLLSG